MKKQIILYTLNGKSNKSVEKLTVQFKENEHKIERIESKYQLNHNAFIVRTVSYLLGVCNCNLQKPRTDFYIWSC